MKAKPSAFLKSYSHLLHWVRARVLAASDVNAALSLARVYGDLLWMNHDGVYQDDEVEKLVEQKVLQCKGYSPPDFSRRGTGTVLIVSELYGNGGHSAVVMNWMRLFRDAGDHKLLITRPVTSKVEKSLAREGILYHFCINRGVSMVNEILRHTVNSERIVLHIHPSDIVSAIAARILAQAGKTIYFYNHADHVFSYGISSATTICEISSYGMALNNRTGRVKNSFYLGIPINFREDQRYRRPVEGSDRVKTVLSCGESGKYAPSNVFFGDFIDCLLLQEPNVTILLVGPTGDEFWWRGHVSRWGKSVQFLGRLDHDKYVEIMERADVYVDSFPITGGTAFPEALLNGKLVAGLQNPIQGYSPADELRVENVKQLTERVIKLLMRDPASVRHVVNVRDAAKSIHSISRFRERIKNISTDNSQREQMSAAAVDTYWIENNWQQRQEINFPFWTSLNELPLIYRLGFFLQLKNALAFLKYSYIVKFLLIVIIKPQKWLGKLARL